jgi:hypothetical protein
VENGQAGVQVVGPATLNWGPAMIEDEPQFVDAANGDYHLLYTSPCRDSGDPAAPDLPAEDFEGDPRIDYGGPDMGADEFSLHLYFTGDAVPGGAVEVKCVDTPGVTQVALIVGAFLENPPLPSDFGLWYIAPPFQLIHPLPPLPAGGVLALPGQIPASPAGPYAVYLQGVIDYTLTNLCTVAVE